MDAGPPPPVPDFDDSPPPIPEFNMMDEEPAGDSMLDLVFDELSGETLKKNKAIEKTEEPSENMLDAVFAEINGPSQQTLPMHESPQEDSDSLLDSVFASIGAATAQNEPRSATPPVIRIAPAVQHVDHDDDDDLLGNVLSQIQAGGDSGPSKEQKMDQLMEAMDVSRAAVRPTAGPPRKPSSPSPGVALGPAVSPLVSRRPRVKSFAPNTMVLPANNKAIHVNRSVSTAESADTNTIRKFVRDTNRSRDDEIVAIELFNLGQRNPPNSLRLWKNQVLIITAGDKVVLRTLVTGGKLQTIDEPGVKVTMLDEEGERLWLCGKNPNIKVYDLNQLNTGQPAFTLTSHSEWVAAIQIVSDKLVATASADKTIRLWTRSLSTLQSGSLKGHLDYVTCLCTAPDPAGGPDLLVSGSCDKTIRIWNLQSQSEVRILYGHRGWIWSIISDGADQLWSCGREGNLCNWDIKTGECLKTIKVESNVSKLVWWEKTLYAIDESLVISTYRKGKLYRRMTGHTGKIRCIAFMGNWMFTSGEDRVIRKWDAQSGAKRGVLKGHTDTVTDLRAFPEQGKLYSCSDDGSVREWQLAKTSQAEGDEGVLMSHMSGLHEREAHLVRLRQLMKDPMYRAAARCQAIIRMRFVRDSIDAHRILMPGAKGRYTGICNLIYFGQNLMATLSQFLSGFLGPVLVFAQRHGAVFEGLGLKPARLEGISSALYALYTFHSTLIEKLEAHKLEYPFCVETGSILQSDVSESQLYLLVVDFLPTLADIGIWEVAPSAELFQRIESEMSIRLDHSALRTFLWSLAKICAQVRLPVIQILGDTPANYVAQDSVPLCAALARFSFMEPLARQKTEVVSERLALTRLLYQRIPAEASLLDRYFASTRVGKLLVNEPCQLKIRSKKDQVRLIVTTAFVLIVSDTANPKKDRLIEFVRLSNVDRLEMQVQVQDLQISLIPGGGRSLLSVVSPSSPNAGALSTSSSSLTTLSPSTSSGNLRSRSKVATPLGDKMHLIFDAPEKAEFVRREVTPSVVVAKFGITWLSLDQQVALSSTASSRISIPAYPAILMQYLAQMDDLTLVTTFKFPSSEIKVSSLANGYNSVEEPMARASALAALLPACGVQNVFAALIEYFFNLEEPLVDGDLRRKLVAAGTVEELRDVVESCSSPAAKDLLSYTFWFLGKRFLPSLDRSYFEDPCSVLAAIVSAAIFWDPADGRRMLMDASRSYAACLTLLRSFQEVFPRVTVSQVVRFDDSRKQLEEHKRAARLKYEAGEAERTKLIEEKERKGVQQVHMAVLDSANDKIRKAKLEELVAVQREDFEKSQAEEKERRLKKEDAFERLQRQQRELEERNEKKLQLVKDKRLPGAGAGGKSHSEVSLDSFLTGLNETASQKNKASDRVRGGAKARVASMQDIVHRQSSSASLSPGSTLRPASSPRLEIDKPVPMIKIPELQMSAAQKRLIIRIPKLSH